MDMPFIVRPDRLKIKEGNETIDAFLMEVLRVIQGNSVYGMYVVLFDNDNNAHGYQFNLRDEDYENVGAVALEHKELYL
jgi:hypothetical protein